MAAVVWGDVAIAQIEAIIDYVELFDPRAAIRLAIRLRETGNSLSQFPNRGRQIGGGVRQLALIYPISSSTA